MTASEPHRTIRLTPAQEALLERKRIERTAAIDALVAEAERNGEPNLRSYWTMVHDFQQARVTTNLAQLAEIGIEPPPAEGLDAEELAAAIDLVARGLAVLGIHLLHTDHLNDAELYRRLLEEILVEPVRDVPPNPEMTEFIDLLGGHDDAESMPPKVCDRDRTLPQAPRRVD